MIDDILNAMVGEAQAFVSSIADPNLGSGQVLLMTNFKNTEVATYKMPLILLQVTGADDASLYPGGLKRVDWNWGFSSYHYMPDPGQNDLTGYAASLLKIVDLITDHFAAALIQGGWLTQAMTDVFTNYGFQLTLNGISHADDLGEDGMIMGWRTNFESTALFRGTKASQLSTQTLQKVQQINNPPFN